MHLAISNFLFTYIRLIFVFFLIIFSNFSSQSNETLDSEHFIHSQLADRVVVLKASRKMVVMRSDRVLKIFRIALGRYPKGHKTREICRAMPGPANLT